MQIFEHNPAVVNIYHRAMRLFICKDFAAHYTDKVTPIAQQTSEQENRRRQLLSVEVQAQQDKTIAEQDEEFFQKQVKRQFFNRLISKVNKDFGNKEYFYHHVLRIEDACPTILDVLSTPSASVNEIKDLVDSMAWLSSNLIHLVNKPQYRTRADIQVNDAKLALSYIGLNNVKWVMPTLILKHWLPVSTAPYGLMKQKLWNDSLSVALAARCLSLRTKQDPFTVFAAAMLTNIGNIAITSCFFSSFNELHKQQVNMAFNNQDKHLHDVLLNTKISKELLLEQLIIRSASLSADLIKIMAFNHLAITKPIVDLACTNTTDKMHPTARLIVKAKAFVTYRSLFKEGLITPDEREALFDAANLTTSEVALLQEADIAHIKLHFS